MSQQPFTDHPSGTSEFYRSLPTKHVGAGCLFCDNLGRVLLVKPVYKDPWEIPGGGVEADESPLAACIREVREELDFDLRDARLRSIDYRRPVEGVRGDALRFVFFGGVLSDDDTARFHLQASELAEWRFVRKEDLDAYVTAVMARRLRASLASTEFVYLEEGHPK
ncbi:MAG: NUDIX domain-containing protein [Acidimicrobiales bacterium]